MPENSVVVNLKAYEQARRGISPEHLALIYQCRDRLIEGTIQTLARHGEDMQRKLIAMADRAPLQETRNAYFGAQSLLLRQGTALMAACKTACVDACNARIDPPRGASPLGDGLELSLIGDDDYEATLVVDKAAARWRFASAEALLPFDARMGALLATPGLPENDNPLGPKILCQALFDGIGRVEAQQDVKIVLLAQFDDVLGNVLGELYQDLNRYLIENRILPELKLGKLQRNPSRTAPSGMSEESADDDDMATLFERLAHQGGAGRPGGGLGGGPGGGAFRLLDNLGALQQGGVPLPGGGQFALPNVQTLGAENVLRVLQASPLMQAASPLDAVMVDAIALLFDVIFEDKQAPDRLKALIARLQIPVLRNALQDRSLFTHRDHPVRRVLDALARLAPRVPEGESGTQRLTRIEEIVDRLLEQAETGNEAFEQAATALGALESESDQAIETGIAPEVAELAQSERAEMAPVIVHDLVNRALDGQAAPQVIRAFLREDWAALLRQDYIEQGEDSPLLKDDTQTMRDLIWSVSPKVDTEARLSLVRLLPGLLKKLRAGCQRMLLAQERTDQLFAALVSLHAHAVRPGDTVPPIAQAVVEDTPPPPPVVVTQASAEPVLQDDFTEFALALEKGDWLEFDADSGGKNMVRLGWISRSRNTYLFSDPDGLSSFSIGLPRLADKLRNGSARLIDRNSITESAFDKLLKRIRAKLGQG